MSSLMDTVAITAAVVILLAGLLVIGILGDVVRGWRLWRTRRAISRLSGGPTHADPARQHREIMRTVDRLARRLPLPQSPLPDAGVATGRGGRARPVQAAPGVDDPTQKSGGVARATAVAAPRVDRDTDYAQGTALVCPPRRLNGTRTHE